MFKRTVDFIFIIQFIGVLLFNILGWWLVISIEDKNLFVFLLFFIILGIPLLLTFKNIIKIIIIKINKKLCNNQNTKVIILKNFQIKKHTLYIDDNTGKVYFYYVECKWINPVNNKRYIFRSENFWHDPKKYIKDSDIRIYINPKHPKVYYIDCEEILIKDKEEISKEIKKELRIK